MSSNILVKKEYEFEGFSLSENVYFKFLEVKENISKDDLADILDMAEQLDNFEMAFIDYLDSIN